MNTDWIHIWGKDPPSPPKGYSLETRRDYFLGYVVAYRFVKEV